MQCRLTCPTNNSICSSFLFTHFDYTNTLNHCTHSPSPYHDQKPTSPVPRRRRRRLEDPVVTHASNDYVSYPRPTSHSPSLAVSPPPPPLPRRSRQKSEEKHIYCDLFNLLERPPPIKQRKIYTTNDSKLCRGHRSIVYKNIHAKIKDSNERKRHHHHEQQTLVHQEKKYQQEKLSSVHLSSKGFFRRVVRNYFCMPMTVTNGEVFK